MMMSSKENRGNWLAAAAFAALSGMAMPSPALAANTMGDLVSAMGQDIAHPLMMLLVCGAYLAGFWLCFNGLMKLVNIADKGFTEGGADGLMRIAGGSLLCALPDAMNSGIATFYQNSGGYQGNIRGATVGGVTNCLTGSGSASAMTCVAQNVATNLVPVFVEVSFIMCYIVGVTMVLHTLFALSKSHAQGSRGMPDGWTSKLVVGFLLCNVPHLMYAVESSMGLGSLEIMTMGASGLKQGATTVPSMLAYNAGSTGIAMLQQYQDLIGWIFVILVAFGVIAVYRGITHLKAHSEGNKQGSLGTGLTHIIGGVMLANGKASTCLILSTFLGQGLGFCN